MASVPDEEPFTPFRIATPQPHPENDRLLARFHRCHAMVAAYSGTVYRAASVRRANRADLLSGEGSRRFGGRWNPPGLFRTVYASLHIETAIAEALAQNRRNGLPDKEGLPIVLCAADLRLEKVLDLTEGRIRRILNVSAHRMTTEPHGLATESITQAIGRLANSLRLEGLLVPSAAVRGGVNIVVFPGSLTHPDQLLIHHPDELPPDAL